MLVVITIESYPSKHANKNRISKCNCGVFKGLSHVSLHLVATTVFWRECGYFHFTNKETDIQPQPQQPLYQPSRQVLQTAVILATGAPNLPFEAPFETSIAISVLQVSLGEGWKVFNTVAHRRQGRTWEQFFIV